MPQCRGYGCTSTELIKAHIIPQSFGRFVQNGSGPNIMISGDRYSLKTPRGVFDTKILCADCDGYLNTKYDDPAFRFFKNFDLASVEMIHLGTPPNKLSYFGIPNVGSELLSGFVLSVLWRASISTRPEVSTVALGPYEDQVRDVLWGVKPLAELAGFALTLQRYRSQQVEIEKTYSMPNRLRSPDGRRWYGFACLGFRVQAKLDRQPLEPFFRGFVINHEQIPRALMIDFEKTLEARDLKKMTAAARARGLRRRV